MEGTRVHFLGAGDAFSAGGRHQASYLLESPDGAFLLDCGVTTLASLKRDRIDPLSIDGIFISHLHGDHFAGIPFLLLEYTYQSLRERPLCVAGPPGTEQRIRRLFEIMYRESAERPLPFELQFVTLLPDQPTAVQGVELHPFRVPHQQAEISLGLGVRTDGRSLLYSGDTGWTEDLVTHARDTDLFICECCFYETRIDSHLDYPRLSQNRGRFETRRLVLTHLGREVLERMDRIEIETARDGLVVELNGG